MNKSASNIWLKIIKNQGWIVFALTIVIGIFFSFFNENFLTLSNINTIGLNSCILVILAAAEGVVIIAGKIDVSIASMLALSSFVGFDFLVRFPQFGAFGLIVFLLLGGVCGVINGWLVGYLKLAPIVVTLGMMSIYRGLAVMYAAGQQINAHQIPRWVNSMINGKMLGISNLLVYALVVVIGIYLFMYHFPVGRKIYAVGSNSEAAAYFGLNINRTILLSYIICGVLIGLAGFLFGGRSAYIAPYYAEGWEMQAIAAVCLGGINMSGGSGNVVGAALGALLLATLENGLVLLGAPEFVREMIYGAAIVISIVVNATLSNRVQEIIKKNKDRRRQQA